MLIDALESFQNHELKARIILFDGMYRDQSLDIYFRINPLYDIYQEIQLLDEHDNIIDSKNGTTPTSLRIKNVQHHLIKKDNIRNTHEIRHRSDFLFKNLLSSGKATPGGPSL